jgi:single-strand DNA-binding protein
MNNVTLSGHLTHEPNLIHRDDRPICEMRLAVDNGEHGPTYIDVRTFDAQAYICTEYLHKGSKIGVTGRLIYREWRAADDVKRERYSVIGWVEFLDRPPREEAEEIPEPEPADPQLALVG